MSNCKERKLFYIFLVVHLVVWTAISLIRLVLPTDALEGIYWGSLHDFGTPKHPPMAAWLTYLAYIPFKADISIYLLSQGFILLGFIYIYKLARKFLDENKSFLSVIILEGCWVYTYITCYYGFNPDVILLFTLPCISYYFYKCMNEEGIKNWIILGLVVGFSFLNKYQTAFLILPMVIWTLIYKKETFKNKYFYLAVLIAFLMFLPHLVWLFEYDFFPITYFEGELSSNSWFNHISAPLTFVLVQFSLIIGSILIFLITKKVYNLPIIPDKTHKKKDMYFIFLLGFLPFLIHLLMGFIVGGTMRPRWGFEFWFMLGIMLFYFFPIKIEKREFTFILKLSYIVMLISALALGGLLSIEKNYRSRYPVETLFEDFNCFWISKYKRPLKYLGGYIEWTLPLTIYGKTHPKIILDTFGYKNPWIDENDLRKSGIFILDRTVKELERDVFKSAPYLPKDYKIKPITYNFFVKNAFGFKREYTIYYVTIPPEM